MQSEVENLYELTLWENQKLVSRLPYGETCEIYVEKIKKTLKFA